MARRGTKKAVAACAPTDRRLTKKRVYAAGELFHVRLLPSGVETPTRLLLKPGVPKDPMAGEDATIGRVCLAHSPGDALAAIEAWNWRFRTTGARVVHIYTNESSVEARLPPKSLLPDVQATGEVWCRCPVPAVLVATINAHETASLLRETDYKWVELNEGEEAMTITEAKPHLGAFMDLEADVYNEQGIMGWLGSRAPKTEVEAAVARKAEDMLNGDEVKRPPVSGTPLQCNPRGNPQTEFYRLLQAHGAVLLRQKNHRVYALPSGQRIVAPNTTSDWRSWKNALAQLKRLLRAQQNPVEQFEEFWNDLPPALRAELSALPRLDPRRLQRYWHWINTRHERREEEQRGLFDEDPPHDFPPPRPPLAGHNPPRAIATLRKVRRVVGKSRVCYPAAEVVFHAGGGRRAGLVPVQQQHEGESHWWVRGPQGEVLDPAAAQFRSPVPYEEGRGRGFLTSRPSVRARQLAKIAGVKLNPPRGDERIRALVRQALATDAIPERAAAAHALERTPFGHFVEERVALALPVRVRQIRFGNREGLISEIEREGEATITLEDMPPASSLPFGAPIDLWQLAQRKLDEWGRHAPSGGGYHKTDFHVEWEDGDTYNGRYDLVHGGLDDGGHTLRQHVKGYLMFRSGIRRPAWTLNEPALRDGTWERMRMRDEESGASTEALRMLRRYFPDARQDDGVPRSL